MDLFWIFHGGAFHLEPPAYHHTFLQQEALPRITSSKPLLYYIAGLLHLYFEFLPSLFGISYQSDAMTTWSCPMAALCADRRKTSEAPTSNVSNASNINTPCFLELNEDARLLRLTISSTVATDNSHPLYLDLQDPSRLEMWHDLWTRLPIETQRAGQATWQALGSIPFYQEEEPNDTFFEHLRRWRQRQAHSLVEDGDASQASFENVVVNGPSRSWSLSVKRVLQELTYEELYHTVRARLHHQSTETTSAHATGPVLVFRRPFLTSEHVTLTTWHPRAVQLAICNAQPCNTLASLLRMWERHHLHEVPVRHLGMVLLDATPQEAPGRYYALAQKLRCRHDIFWLLRYTMSSTPTRNDMQALKEWASKFSHALVLETNGAWTLPWTVGQTLTLTSDKP